MQALSKQARLYITSMMVVGAALLVWQLPLLAVKPDPWLLLVGLLAAAGQVLNVEGVTTRSNYNAGLAAYGFALLAFHLPGALLVMVAACLIDWAWHRYPWYIQMFNVANMAVSLACAAFVLTASASVFGTSQGPSVAAAAAASLVFVVANHIGVGGVIRLARKESLRESGIFGRLPLVIDATVFSLGAMTGALWSLSPLVLVMAVMPLYPIYLALRVPALQRQVNVDAKTGLFNTVHFNAEVARELERADRFDRPLTVVLGDLDLLRNVNNTFGHLAGDTVLIGVADILKRSVREFDVVARFGGEEFAILMPETTPEDAAAHINAIREQIAAAGYDVETSVNPIQVTMSFGVAGRTRAGQTGAQLMHQADLAVYRAKLEGRNRVCVSDGDEDAAFVPFVSASPEPGAHPDGVVVDAAPAESIDAPSEVPVFDQTGRTWTEPEAVVPDDVAPSEAGSTTPQEPHHETLSLRAVKRRVVITAGLAVLAYALVFLLVPHTLVAARFLGVEHGLLVLGFLTLASEFIAIEIYARDTSVSTAAAVLIAGAVLFGPVGVLVLSALAACAAMVRNHSAISKLTFNASVHSLAGLSAVLIALIVAPPQGTWGNWRWAFTCVAASLIYFVFTTAAVAWAISWSGGEPARAVWRERFSWLAPYYVGLGLAA